MFSVHPDQKPSDDAEFWELVNALDNAKEKIERYLEERALAEERYWKRYYGDSE